MAANASTSVVKVRAGAERCPLAKGPRWFVIGREQSAAAGGNGLRLQRGEEDTVDLVRKIRSGREEAWGRLMNRYGGRLERYAERRLGKDLRRFIEPQDIASEAWMRVVRNLEIWKPGGPRGFYRWLCLQVRRVILDKRREIMRREPWPAPLASGEGGIDGEPADSSSGPVSRTSRRDQVNLATRVLLSLPKTYREPLVAILVEGKSRADVAAGLGISANNLSQRLHRGLDLWRERLHHRPHRRVTQTSCESGS